MGGWKKTWVKKRRVTPTYRGFFWVNPSDVFGHIFNMKKEELDPIVSAMIKASRLLCTIRYSGQKDDWILKLKAWNEFANTVFHLTVTKGKKYEVWS